MNPLGMFEFKNNRLMIIKADVAVTMRVDGRKRCKAIFEFLNAKVINTALETINNAITCSNCSLA